LSLRLKLFLLALLTLVLPVAGCQYAREMESVLREGERQSLLAVAQTIATSLQGRERLLYRDQRWPAALAARHASPGLDLEPLPLAAEPLIDGFADDWPQAPHAWQHYRAGGDTLALLCGSSGRYLYLLLEVHDAAPLYDAPGVDLLDPAGFGDRVWLAFDEGEDNALEGAPQHQYFLATTGPGSLVAHRIETREYGRRVAVPEPRIEAAWRGIDGGYRIEVRVPLSLIGARFGVLLDDRATRGATPLSLGNLRPGDLEAEGRLLLAPPELGAYLRQFSEPGVQLAVGSARGALLAEVNALPPAPSFGAESLLARFYRRLLDGGEALRAPGSEPGRLAAASARAAADAETVTTLERSADDRRLIVAAASPIYDASHARVIGVVQVAQTEERWLLLRDRALARLLNLTLAATALAVLGSFAFAARLGFRLTRLRNATETALGTEGRLVTRLPEASARDELGDLARSFAALLDRLEAYTAYLRTLAGKLAHEIRTPLTIVRSSLENLEHEGVTETARPYVARARQGAERLGGILQAMGAATRVEEAIAAAERLAFDLAPVVAAAVDAYRQAFTTRRFELELGSGPCRVEGSPELMVQLLDKLIDNAIDFSPAGSRITVRLHGERNEAWLEVENPGSRLPPDAGTRLFESLWQSREAQEEAGVHFGLGLYVARLIADFHRGSMEAANLAAGQGVRMRLRVPLLS
jgi:dedicated sortase system histidine kinase